MEFAVKSVKTVMTPTSNAGRSLFYILKMDGFGLADFEKIKEVQRMPKIASKAKRLRIYIGESDRWKGRPMFQAIVGKAKELGLAGATVFRGLMGYGAHSRIHTASIVDLSSDLPILVEIVDSEEYINLLRPYLDDMLEGGMMTIEDIEVIKYGDKQLK